ncbi:MAG: yuxK [Cytophagaceae bacterium]|jgi:predicted DCC family thiol-disulfide oxidoreductase YuxK|nr:yuxK [Cytophagaceae bacterium]
MDTDHSQQNIVFFDGVCGLCNRAIDFLMRKDKKKVLLFAPLQGSTAAKLLPYGEASSLSSMVYYSQGRISYRTKAILNLLWDMGGWWTLFSIFRIVPAFIRDIFYNWMAASRYKWFGKKETCRIPTVEERGRFLD